MKPNPERKEVQRSIIRLEDALARCRTQDVRYGLGIAEALDFLERRAIERWAFKQFRDALEDFDASDTFKSETRWRRLSAALRSIKRNV